MAPGSQHVEESDYFCNIYKGEDVFPPDCNPKFQILLSCNILSSVLPRKLPRNANSKCSEMMTQDLKIIEIALE